MRGSVSEFGGRIRGRRKMSTVTERAVQQVLHISLYSIASGHALTYIAVGSCAEERGRVHACMRDVHLVCTRTATCL